MATKKVVTPAKKEPETKPKEFENKLAVSILAYLLIGIIWYFVDEDAKKDEFVKFHVQQGIVVG
jgi:hypothetical protein